MRDLQNETTGFPRRPIQSAGVDGIKALLPIRSSIGDGRKIIKTLADFSTACPLPPSQRGLNMSRMGRAVYAFIEDIENCGVETLEPLARRIIEVNGAPRGIVRASFEYPIIVLAPVTGTKGIKFVHAAIGSKVSGKDTCNTLEVTTSEMSLCPCSKLMSLTENNLTPEEALSIASLPLTLQEKLMRAGQGAHNQLFDIKAELTLSPLNEDGGSRYCTIEDIYKILSSCASVETYPVLRREDEKCVTERAWSNPRFVEDIVRIAADKLDNTNGISSYRLSVTSHESIHSNGITASASIIGGKS